MGPEPTTTASTVPEEREPAASRSGPGSLRVCRGAGAPGCRVAVVVTPTTLAVARPAHPSCGAAVRCTTMAGMSPDDGPADGPAAPASSSPPTGAVRVAAVDCGTNSLRLLVADVVARGSTDPGAPGSPGSPAPLVDVVRRMEVVRLGEGVDRTGAFAPAALERTLAATDRCAETIRATGATRVRFVATSASRDVSNADLLRDGVRERLGVQADVVTGLEEASLSFAGATAGLPAPASGEHAAHLVVDLGGGSTELVLGSPGRPGGLRARSMDVGCVRLTERHALSDPPTHRQAEAVRADVRAALGRAGADVPLADARVLVGVAGTVTTITAHALRLDAYDPARLHGAVLGVPDVLAACEDLVAMTRERRAALPFMHPGRVDVIGAGALVWSEVVAAVHEAGGVEQVVTSEHDILDGIALALAADA